MNPSDTENYPQENYFPENYPQENYPQENYFPENYFPRKCNYPADSSQQDAIFVEVPKLESCVP